MISLLRHISKPSSLFLKCSLNHCLLGVLPTLHFLNLKIHIINQEKRKFSLGWSLFKHEKDDFEDEEIDTEYAEMSNRLFHIPEMGHQVLVLQPYTKWGSSKKRNTTPDLQLAEAVSLINTLKNWKVVDKMKVPLTSLDKKTLFGSGKLDSLKRSIRSNVHITAVFISVDMLQRKQHKLMENMFGVPVYDRYMIVIQIFRAHAVSKEAKLQVAMAEIPYLRMKMKGLVEGAADHLGSAVATIGGAGETPIEVRRRIINKREMKLKAMLQKVRSQRLLLRSKRKDSEYPIVAVVGYTNVGKTSLIKALTGEEKLKPKDNLFATLDVTAHAGMLPSQLKVLYIDTVGFISDIPTNLIESFTATLEDALFADVVMHVCDVSHPDTEAQFETVSSTLKKLNLGPEKLKNLIIVGNKADLLPQEQKNQHPYCNVLVSAATQQGLNELISLIETCILRETGRQSIVIRVSSGGEEMNWLYKNAAVTDVAVDPESSEHLLMSVVISKSKLNIFQHHFIKKSDETL